MIFYNLFLKSIKIQRGNLIAVGNIGGLVPIQRVPRKYMQEHIPGVAMANPRYFSIKSLRFSAFVRKNIEGSFF
jgi:hypothetical protein